jgi:hypothetical protein
MTGSTQTSWIERRFSNLSKGRQSFSSSRVTVYVQGMHNVGDEIDTILLGPPTDKDEHVLFDPSPFLCLPLDRFARHE